MYIQRASPDLLISVFTLSGRGWIAPRLSESKAFLHSVNFHHRILLVLDECLRTSEQSFLATDI